MNIDFIKGKFFLTSVSFMLVAAGFLFLFWPLSVAGILLAALGGRPLAAVLLALLIDVAYGAPAAWFHFVYFPFTVLALLGILARALSVRYLLKKSPQETL